MIQLTETERLVLAAVCPGFVVLLMLCAESVRWNWVHSAFLVRVVVVFSGRRGGGGSAAACGGTHFTEVCESVCVIAVLGPLVGRGGGGGGYTACTRVNERV